MQRATWSVPERQSALTRIRTIGSACIAPRGRGVA
jgi:hypothetical protein